MPRLGIVLAALLPVVMAANLPARVPVVVVTESGVDAYAEALSGITATLPAGSFQVIDVAAKSFGRDLSGGVEPRVVIALGSRALAEVRSRHLSGTLVSAMCVHSNNPDANTWRVNMDIAPGAELTALRGLWPGRTRIGLIRSPSVSRSALDNLEALARKEGFSVVEVSCDGPAHLLKSVAALKGKADFLLCLPDVELYNPVTLKPLVLASLEQRLPLIGFSPAFVRAGAAAGVFPDYQEVGRQAAEMAVKALRGEPAEDEEAARKIRVAVNQRVTRLLGVEFRSDAVNAEVYH